MQQQSGDVNEFINEFNLFLKGNKNNLLDFLKKKIIHTNNNELNTDALEKLILQIYDDDNNYKLFYNNLIDSSSNLKKNNYLIDLSNLNNITTFNIILDVFEKIFYKNQNRTLIQIKQRDDNILKIINGN